MTVGLIPSRLAPVCGILLPSLVKDGRLKSRPGRNDHEIEIGKFPQPRARPCRRAAASRLRKRRRGPGDDLGRTDGGLYVAPETSRHRGIADKKKDKHEKIPATPVGEIVAHGDAEIGLQQISELKPVAGIDIVGPLPDELQKITVFSAGIATVSKEPEAGKALIKFLASPAARDVIVKSGMEPIRAGATN